MKLVSNVKNRVKTNLNALAKTIKYYFYYAPKRFVYFKYYALYEMVTLKLLAVVTPMVRTLIVRLGKDPDYVAPPLPPPAPPQEEPKRRPTINIPYVPSWTRASFKSIAKHPVYQSRVNLNLQPNYLPKISEPLQVALAPEPAPEPAPEVIVEVPPEPSKDDISVDDTGNITYGFIKYGDDNES